MSTIFDLRSLKLPKLSRATIIVSTLIVVLALVAAFIGYNLYKRLTTNTVVAYFADTLALYPGDKVQIMGVKVGAIDKIEPDGDKMKVTFHYDNKYKVPANATASILNPSLVASRTIQLAPPYTGGPVLENNAVIPLERTQVPVEYDQLRDSIARILTDLGPTPEQPKGPFGDIIESAADGFAGKGKQLNETLNNLSEALYALNEGRDDFFSVVKSLALFVNALHQSDRQFVALNNDLAQFTNAFTNTDREVSNALRDLNELLSTTRNFLDENSEVLVHDVNNLADVTNAIMQEDPRNGLETALHVFPTLGANLMNIISPNTGGVMGIPVINNFANPLQFVCSGIQAASRLGYQESAELCAQYLAPILDAIKFNFPPFGVNQFTSALTLPKQIAYSEPRLQPPPGYKDTTVPGIFSRDTLFSHGNHEPGWVAAPGMQGVEVQPFTANMMTPECLAELLGGPNCVIPPAPPAFGTTRGGNLPGPPNAFDENNPLPPPWYPQPGPPPAPGPGVIPGDPGGAAMAGPVPAPYVGPAAPAPAGPPLPAEAGR
ncbi:virulence factor Mce family protein [Mycolicibacterium phlei]|uniref:Mammalian cell entry protein n=1 Tax=Mycolicibacterium phlei DSM 43239 = CCUG 21000 TaxID=1226750 RepID=A0A5N5UY88_MYCPH|nr:virulence factor Mce family protein [Mycolicibacterium phlei]VEG07077.1 virulence factor Mce family protein [Mycobacteroides chelonae]AMO58945.1 mce related protein [Mycolicibacterium phlei]KAB7754526.1 mammalian cell entry protein [Mycolicibacterium phlei DSM 43239 = CCUG 21000]KXW59985.1 mammalian cell entry protein [Mycolicibacterium phlei DSM 43070]KXW65172.1 mammalian cell entry protein [Mycolicibacterium phlei DSM 43239 = CCUG 21000]